jgi:hypothetical protein
LLSKPLKVAAAAACLLAIGATPASAKQHLVDDDKAQCPKADFTSIQAAVNAASPGDKVNVCPGEYEEQVRVSNKDGIELNSTRTWQAVIKFPVVTTPPNALVHIQNSDDVEVNGFTITGPFHTSGCVAPALTSQGVFVDNSDDAEIRGNHVTKIKNANPALYGCQDGIAVLVGRGSVNSVGSADLKFNLIDDYQKGGVVVDNAGSEGDVSFNAVEAAEDVQSIVAPNGIQVSRGATGKVDHNVVSENKYTPQTTVGSGILLFQAAAGTRIEHNKVFDNDVGVNLFDQDQALFAHNSSDKNTFDGLFADEDSRDNLFKENSAFDNGEFDCDDVSTGTGTAGTANRWIGNRGETDNPDGICRDKRSGHGRGKRGHGWWRNHSWAD